MDREVRRSGDVFGVQGQMKERSVKRNAKQNFQVDGFDGCVGWVYYCRVIIFHKKIYEGCE